MQRSRARQPGRLQASDATGWPCSGTGTLPNHTGPASCVTVPVLSAYLYVACTPRWQSPGWGLPLGGWPGPSSIQRLGWRLCDPVTGSRPSWGPPRGFARVRYQPRPLGSQIRRGYMLRLELWSSRRHHRRQAGRLLRQLIGRPSSVSALPSRPANTAPQTTDAPSDPPIASSNESRDTNASPGPISTDGQPRNIQPRCR